MVVIYLSVSYLKGDPLIGDGMKRLSVLNNMVCVERLIVLCYKTQKTGFNFE